MEALRAAIRKAARDNPTGEPKALARRVIASLKKADWVDMVAVEIAHVLREIARDSEASAFRAFFEQPTAPDFERLKTVFNTPISLGDGFSTSWGAATVEQHRQRIAFLEKLREGIAATIQRHEEAIRLIEGAGVTCLNELGGESKAA